MTSFTFKRGDVAMPKIVALLFARHGVPKGTYRVDAEALRRARQGVPTGEYHHNA